MSDQSHSGSDHPEQPGPLSAPRWQLAADTFGEAARQIDRAADADERRAVAAALALLDLERLRITGVMRPLGRRRFSLKGHLEAVYRQACVVTLDPVPASFTLPLDVEFRPQTEMPEHLEEQDMLLDERELEPIMSGTIALGRLAYELLAVSVDPFPRAPGAALEQVSAGSLPEHPLAALKHLRDRRQDDDEP
jgi:hypothetical protein